jgi:hypothetical protein
MVWLDFIRKAGSLKEALGEMTAWYSLPTAKCHCDNATRFWKKRATQPSFQPSAWERDTKIQSVAVSCRKGIKRGIVSTRARTGSQVIPAEQHESRESDKPLYMSTVIQKAPIKKQSVSAYSLRSNSSRISKRERNVPVHVFFDVAWL